MYCNLIRNKNIKKQYFLCSKYFKMYVSFCVHYIILCRLSLWTSWFYIHVNELTAGFMWTSLLVEELTVNHVDCLTGRIFVVKVSPEC